MKFFKIFAIVLILFALSTTPSHAESLDDPNSELRTCVTKLLINPKIGQTVDEEVRISFFVTADEKLVVLKTDARTKPLDEFIKIRMNYKKIKIEDLEVNRIFHMKVHFALE